MISFDNIINAGDTIEIITKLKQSGVGFFLSKLTFNKKKRTERTFSGINNTRSNWWVISEVKYR